MSEPAEVESGPKRNLVLDTHVLVHFLEGNTGFGARARRAIEGAAGQDAAFVSAITPWEIALLVSKGRLQLGVDVLEWVRVALGHPGFQLIALEPEIAVASTRLPFEMHADPADRILVATARQLGATLVTADRELLKLAKKGYFRAMDARV